MNSESIKRASHIAGYMVLFCVFLMPSGCHYERSSVLLSIRINKFAIERASGTLHFPVMSGKVDIDNMQREITEAEYYYKKLSTTIDFRKFEYMSTFTLDTVIHKPETSFKPWIVHKTRKDSIDIEVYLESIANGEPKFRITRISSDTLVYSFTANPARSAAIGLMDSDNSENWTTLIVTTWVLQIEGTPIREPVIDLLSAKNRVKGTNDSTSIKIFQYDQDLIDRHFGKGAVQLPITPLNTENTDIDSQYLCYPYVDSLDAQPLPVGGFEVFYRKMNYPESARRDTVTGTVVLNFLVDSTGVIRSQKVAIGIREDLDLNALALLDSVLFNPPTVKGRKVNIRLTLPVRYALK